MLGYKGRKKKESKGLSDSVDDSMTLKESGMTTFIGEIYGKTWKSYFVALDYNEESKKLFNLKHGKTSDKLHL